MFNAIKNFILFISLTIMVGWTYQSDERILWGQRPIQWEDFKGRPEMRSKYVASLSSGLQMDGRFISRDSILYEVKALMNPQKSWAATSSDTILNHERGHFDITELFARKLRKEISQKKFTVANINKEVSKLFRQINEQLDQMQDRYDEETNHSMIYPKQVLWEKRIQEELLALEAFKQIAVKIRVE